jgi:hypothetical protein
MSDASPESTRGDAHVVELVAGQRWIPFLIDYWKKQHRIDNERLPRVGTKKWKLLLEADPAFFM